jgi:hypothetical protein
MLVEEFLHRSDFEIFDIFKSIEELSHFCSSIYFKRIIKAMKRSLKTRLFLFFLFRDTEQESFNN